MPQMNPTTPAILELARRLVDYESTREPSVRALRAGFRACESLRGPLAKFVGVSGYRSLLTRALAMAKAEVPSLGQVRILPDGSLGGLEGVDLDQDSAAGAVVVAQLLGLLVTFIGETLTLRLVMDAWPDATEGESDRFGEGRS
jgi:hypothetical protein